MTKIRFAQQSAICYALVSFATPFVYAADAPTTKRDLDNVVITGERERERTEPTVETEKLLKIPGSLGDPMQAIYSLPGIVQTQEAGGEPAVRGSGPDDNSFLIDFLPAGYVFHDFGFSIFNENLLRDFGLKNAGFGSRYGKATGAVFDVTLREPRQQPWAFTVDASFLRVGAMAEGQITDSQAMYVSVRESTVHLLLKLRADAIEEEEDISFQEYPRARDFQLKYGWQINETNRLSFLSIGAQDETEVLLGGESDIALIDPGVTGTATLSTGFVSAGLNWIYDDGVNRLQTAAGYLDEARELSSGNGAEFSNTYVDRSTIKSHYQRALGSAHTLGFGGEYQRSDYEYDLFFRYRSCTNFTPDCRVNRGPLTRANETTPIDTIDGFIEDRWQIVDAVALTVGAHTTQNDYLDEHYIEPRAAAEWQINQRWGVSASWGEYHQLPRIGQMVPVFGNPDLESIAATHYVLGVKQEVSREWRWNVDVYYKDLENIVVDVATGEQYLNAATGEAYGAELMINKNRAATFDAWPDRIYGWLALSLSKSKRLNQLNDVEAVFEYDTPVIANFVANVRITQNWEAGLRWTLRSGLPYTAIVANKPNPDFPNFYLPVYGELNGSRASPYHRLDLRVERALNFGRFRGSVYADLINAYNRQQGGAATYKPKPNSSEYELEEEESLPLLPSIGIKLTF
jgi:hypothetical protein